VTGVLERLNLDALIMPTDYSPNLPAYAGTPVVTVPMGYYPSNSTVAKSSRGLVEVGPNIPYDRAPCSLASDRLHTDSLTALAFHSWGLNGAKKP